MHGSLRVIIVQNHIKVNPKYSEEFEKAFSGTNEHLSGMKGFVKNEILKPVKGDSYIVLTYWEDMDSFNAWTQSEAFRQAHSRKHPDDMFIGKSELTIHEVVK